MLPLKRFIFPSKAGLFGAIRKHDIHTGIDLYCDPDAIVYAMHSGIVTRVGQFTGGTESPWWNDTDFLVIKTYENFVLYGEISTTLKVGDKVAQGDPLGKVVTVLKEDKGLPKTMLHLELYTKDQDPVIWPLNTLCPDGLKDPLPLLSKILWTHWYKSTNEEIIIPKGDFFNIAGRGLVMTIESKDLPLCNVGDTLFIDEVKYKLLAIECGGRSTLVGLLIKPL